MNTLFGLKTWLYKSKKEHGVVYVVITGRRKSRDCSLLFFLMAHEWDTGEQWHSQ